MTLHHPAGRVSIAKAYNGYLLTNALPERLLCHDVVTDELFVKDGKLHYSASTDDSFLQRFRVMGITTEEGGHAFQEGKFVYLNDGTFVVFMSVIIHYDVPGLLDKSRVTAIGAGFIYIDDSEVIVYGKSESLDGLRTRIDGSDRKAIMEHLGIPQEADIPVKGSRASA
jgi:hypothetical protein